jgi:hypothetical protein
MSVQKIVTMECDLTGRHSGKVKTYRLGLDGREYELDLCEQHAGRMLSVLGRYRMAAHKVFPRRQVRTAVDREQSRAMRRWLRDGAGYDVPERGRIPQRLVEEYNRHARSHARPGRQQLRNDHRQLSKADLALVAPPQPMAQTVSQRRVMEHVASQARGRPGAELSWSPGSSWTAGIW